ncbi:MAG: hypothetical protein MRY63_03650 [Neomegalonema sp.]|nr:hypothetical protein [Neomegalonema sp.]
MGGKEQTRGSEGQDELKLDLISRNLRKAYNDVATEALPDNLLALLSQLEAKPVEDDRGDEKPSRNQEQEG